MVTATAGDIGSISDGYHTFDELYEHRITLYLLLAKMLHADNEYVWRSRLHSDGSFIPGWFVLGVGYEPGKQITYHLPDKEWVNTEWANDQERAPEFDGHTSSDVIARLRAML